MGRRRDPIGDLKALGCLGMIVLSACSGIVSECGKALRGPSGEVRTTRHAPSTPPPKPTIDEVRSREPEAPVLPSAAVAREAGFRIVKVYHHADRSAGAMGGANGYEIGAPQVFEVLREEQFAECTMLEIRTAAGERGWIERSDSEAIRATPADIVAIERIARSRAPEPEPEPESATEAPAAVTYRPTATTSSPGGSVYVRGYTRKDGTYVRPHTRSR